MFDKTRKLASVYKEDEGLTLLALCQTIIAQRPVVDEDAILERVQKTLHAWHKRERRRRKNDYDYRQWNTRTPSRWDTVPMPEDLPVEVSMRNAGHTLSEIGQHLGVSISTVRRKIKKYQEFVAKTASETS